MLVNISDNLQVNLNVLVQEIVAIDWGVPTPHDPYNNNYVAVFLRNVARPLFMNFTEAERLYYAIQEHSQKVAATRQTGSGKSALSQQAAEVTAQHHQQSPNPTSSFSTTRIPRQAS